MIPIKDNLNPQTRPYVTWALLAANALVFAFQLGLPERLMSQVYLLYGIVPARLIHWQWADYMGFPSGAWMTLITSMFLHGGWLHFIANNWILWLFGDDVEDRIGHVKFLLLYFATGIIAGLTHVAFSGASTVPAIGASGAVAGVMGAFLLLFPRAQIHVLVPIIIFIDIWKIPAALFLPLWFLGELFSGTIALIAPGFSGIAFWAHVGGFVAGLLLLRSLLPETNNQPHRYPARKVEPQIIRGPGFIIINRSHQGF